MSTRKVQKQVLKSIKSSHIKYGIVRWGILQNRLSLKYLLKFSYIIAASIKKNSVMCVYVQNKLAFLFLLVKIKPQSVLILHIVTYGVVIMSNLFVVLVIFLPYLMMQVEVCGLI